MKKILILLAALLVLTGCSGESEHSDSASAYACYMLQGAEIWGDWLVTEPVDVSLRQDPAELMTDLVEAMRAPKNPAHSALLDDSMHLEKITFADGVLDMRFSDGLRRTESYRRLMICTALSRAAAQCSEITTLVVRDNSGLIRIEMAVDGTHTDPEELGVRALEVTLFLNRPQGDALEQVKRTVYIDREQLTMEQCLDLLLSLHGTTGLDAPFDGKVTGFSVESSDGICRINLQVSDTENFTALDVYGLVNTLSGVEGESRFLVSINGAALSNYGIPECDGILFYNTAYIN